MTLFLIILSVISCLIVSFGVVKLNESFDNQCILNSHLEFMEKTPVEGLPENNSTTNSNETLNDPMDQIDGNDDFINTRECN